jgi:hypothetical protein
VDSFGTGLLGQSLASYWFFTRFGISAQELGLMFFASHLLTAISLWVAQTRWPYRSSEHYGLHAHPL